MINVTAAILRRDTKILIARRGPGKHLEGCWEFPGGKVEENELPNECLARELSEELGIKAQIGQYLGESLHDYGEKRVRLLAFEVLEWTGDLVPVDHDRLEWIEPEEAPDWNLAPADIPLLKFID